MDLRRLPMARFLGVPEAELQPVVEVGLAQNGGVTVDAHDADAQLVLAGGVLRRAANALRATDVAWSSTGRPWRGGHATMTPTQMANQLLDRGFRTQHLRFMSGLGYLRQQQQHHLIVPPYSYFGAPAGESPFYMKRCPGCGVQPPHPPFYRPGAACPFCMCVFMYGSDHDDESDSDAPASSASGDDEEQTTDGGSSSDDASGDETHLSPRRSRSRSCSPGHWWPSRSRPLDAQELIRWGDELQAQTCLRIRQSLHPPRGDDDDFGDDIWQSGDESGDETRSHPHPPPRRSRSRSPRDASRRVTTSQ